MRRLDTFDSPWARNHANELNFLCALVFQQLKSFACAVSSGKHWIDKKDLGENRDYNIPAFSQS